MNWMLIRSVCTALNQMMAAALLSVALVSPARARSDHASLVWFLLRSQPELVHQSVATELLVAFLAAEQAGIAEILEAVESWSVTTIEHYPQTPEGLRWGTGHAPTAEHFFAAWFWHPALREPQPRVQLSGNLSHGLLPPQLADKEGAAIAAADLPAVVGGAGQNRSACAVGFQPTRPDRVLPVPAADPRTRSPAVVSTSAYSDIRSSGYHRC